MSGRITTRAGRKIRHVAPGHVVDVATGVQIWQEWHAISMRRVWRTRRYHHAHQRPTLDGMLAEVAVAAGICAFVSWAVRLA